MKKSLLFFVCLAGMTVFIVGCKGLESFTSSIPFINKSDKTDTKKSVSDSDYLFDSKNKDGEIAKAVREERRKAKEEAAAKRNLNSDKEEEKELTPPELLAKANEEFGQKEFYQAEQDYQKYLTLVRPLGQPELLALPYHRMGLISQKRRQMEKAQEYLTLAIQNDPNKNPQITLDYAKVLFDLEEYERSEKLLSYVAENYPEMKEARYYLGQARLNSNPSEELIPLLAEDYGEEEACRMIAAKCREQGKNDLANRLEARIKEAQFQNDQIFLGEHRQEVHCQQASSVQSQPALPEPALEEATLAESVENPEVMEDLPPQVALQDLPSPDSSFLDAEPVSSKGAEEESLLEESLPEIQESEPLPALLPHPDFLESSDLPDPESLPELENLPAPSSISNPSEQEESFPEDENSLASETFLETEETPECPDLPTPPDFAEDEVSESPEFLTDTSENDENDDEILTEDVTFSEETNLVDNISETPAILDGNERSNEDDEDLTASCSQDLPEPPSNSSLGLSLNGQSNQGMGNKGLKIKNSLPVEELTKVSLTASHPGLTMGQADYFPRETENEGVEEEQAEKELEEEDSEDFAWAVSSSENSEVDSEGLEEESEWKEEENASEELESDAALPRGIEEKSVESSLPFAAASEKTSALSLPITKYPKSKKTSEEKLLDAQKAGAKITVLTPDEYKKELATRAKVMVDNARQEVNQNSKLTSKQKQMFLQELEPSL